MAVPLPFPSRKRENARSAKNRVSFGECKGKANQERVRFSSSAKNSLRIQRGIEIIISLGSFDERTLDPRRERQEKYKT